MLENTDIMERAIAGYMEVEQVSDRDEAADNIVSDLLDVKSMFYRLDEIIEEIDRKHSQYMKNAVMRARFKLATGNNTEGKLSRILDLLAEELSREDKESDYISEELADLCSIYTQGYLSPESLRTIPVNKKNGVVDDLTGGIIMTEEERLLYKEALRMKNRNRFSRKNINDYVVSLLQGKEKMSVEEIPIQSNSANKLVEDSKRRIRQIEDGIKTEEDNEKKLNEQIRLLKIYMQCLQNIQYRILSGNDLALLASEAASEQKGKIIEQIEEFQKGQLPEIRTKEAINRVQFENLESEISGLQERLKELEKRNLTYPENTVALKDAIEKEFDKRGIRSKVYILAELLEITDEKWINAVEGYFNKQKFYLIVEPQYYDVALEVYNRKRTLIHSAGIINTKKLPLADELNNKSLAYVVKSENRYAKAYANYLLGRVIRCEDVTELENYDIAITAQCMLYQGYVVRHINPKNYKDPYIGQNAYRTQIVNVKKIIEEKMSERAGLREEIKRYSDVLESEQKFDFTILKLYLNSPMRKAELKKQLINEKVELDKASKDPSLIQLHLDLEEKQKEEKAIVNQQKLLLGENTRLEVQIDNNVQKVQSKRGLIGENTKLLEQKGDADGIAYKEAEEKYRLNRKTKNARTIADNFAPQRTQFENGKNALVDRLKDLQYRYNNDFTQDLMIGLNGISDYRDAAQKLKAIEMIRYEEKLTQAKEECEQIFKTDFLSKMKELIENARIEFRNLNKALDNIYYGDDSYHFIITFDKKKEGLYKMITSENNQEGINLWTAAFEAEYHEEMAELFDKLMTKDDNGQKIVEEYTDYRSYLDYDIEIKKKDGSTQRFSKIYGEKSGSETQVPYYVAIAASFYQLYRYGNSIRIMLLDEAFDKMDDERIVSMLDFFNSLDMQVIMATPPAKIEIIGEKVDTVLTAIRVNQNSIVEEYDF